MKSLKKSKNRQKKSSPRQLKGIVVSDKMKDSATVKVMSLKLHPIYKKRYRSFKKYLAHNPANQFKIGDEIVIEESRPLSKRKRWRIVGKPQNEILK